jgi:nitrogen fixation/metabolism regulation signal transduction histidine kinase
MVVGRIKRAAYTVVLIFGTLLWLSVLLLFSQVAQNSEEFARLQPWILLINIAGIAVLLLLIIGSLVRLIRDYRQHVPGSRLKARMMVLLVVLTVTPLLIVYTFAVQFINRGIDSWFDLDVEQGLSDALDLSRMAMDLQQLEHLNELQVMARRLDRVEAPNLVSQLAELLRFSGALELTIFGSNNAILATVSQNTEAVTVPRYPSEELVFQLRQGDSQGACCVSLEPQPQGGFEILAAVPLTSAAVGGELRIFRARFGVDQRLNNLADRVEASVDQYGELAYLRTALKYSFTLTLSLVLLITMLAAVYGAFFSARRLVVPIQQLMAGTRAVARGDFETRLPLPARDEIGFLVNSFNDMTQGLSRAREETRESQQQVESERRKLEVILARLSTGVVSLETDMRIRTANQAAGAILGLDLGTHLGEPLTDLAASRPLLSQFLAVARAHLERGDHEWREQIVLRGEIGRRVLMCACTALSSEEDNPDGYVIVFDDITALLQAQRDAAWGEVARRLAHEIKNPLTPIQLSAERLRRRYLGEDLADPELLDRATYTIIQQVEAMKEMVNAFSEYARTPDMELSQFDLNELIREVAELYRHRELPLSLTLDLDSALPLVNADAGRMRQVFHNLIRNALDAMEHQPDEHLEISTRFRCSGELEGVEVTVSDNGPGFSAEIVDQIFDPYVTSKPKGTGLGLAIVKKLVEEHGGQIKAHNGERGGAVISILLPISGEAGDTASTGSRRPDKRRQHA